MRLNRQTKCHYTLSMMSKIPRAADFAEYIESAMDAAWPKLLTAYMIDRNTCKRFKHGILGFCNVQYVSYQLYTAYIFSMCMRLIDQRCGILTTLQ